MKQIGVGVIGAGWVGGIRANACASSAIVGELHIAETNQDSATEIAAETGTSSSSSSSVASASATSSDSRKKKAPKLYFYEMSEEDDKAAEGNRFIRNKDL